MVGLHNVSKFDTNQSIRNLLTQYDPGGLLKPLPPFQNFALTHLILELHYCSLVTFPKSSFTPCGKNILIEDQGLALRGSKI